MAEDYTDRGWFLWAGHLDLFFSLIALATPLPFLALPFGGIVDIDKEEQKLKQADDV